MEKRKDRSRGVKSSWSEMSSVWSSVVSRGPKVPWPDWLSAWNWGAWLAVAHSTFWPTQPFIAVDFTLPNYKWLLKTVEMCLCPNTKLNNSSLYTVAVLLLNGKKVPPLNTFQQHLLNVNYFHNLFSFPSWPYYVTDNIPLYRPQWKVQVDGLVYFHMHKLGSYYHQSTTSSYVSNHDVCPWQPLFLCPMG